MKYEFVTSMHQEANLVDFRGIDPTIWKPIR